MFRKLLVTTAAATFLLTAPACSSAQSATTPTQTNQNAVATTNKAARTSQHAAPTDRSRMISEAVAALQETQNALVAIDRNQRDEALQALARATGKLEILLAREPRLALAPVDLTVVTRDVVGDHRTLEGLRERAEESLEKGRLQEARRLISDLASETVVRVSHLPLATYPAALKSAAAQLDRRQAEAAKSTLQAALSTLVVEETIFPLPLNRAEVALNEAKRLFAKGNRSEADRRRLASLLARAREQIRFGQALGYGTEEGMRQLLSEVDQIEERTGQRTGRRFFDRVDALFDRARQSSHAQPSRS